MRSVISEVRISHALGNTLSHYSVMSEVNTNYNFGTMNTKNRLRMNAKLDKIHKSLLVTKAITGGEV
jgi:hypothetical protein